MRNFHSLVGIALFSIVGLSPELVLAQQQPSMPANSPTKSTGSSESFKKFTEDTLNQKHKRSPERKVPAKTQPKSSN